MHLRKGWPENLKSYWMQIKLAYILDEQDTLTLDIELLSMIAFSNTEWIGWIYDAMWDDINESNRALKMEFQLQ